MSADQKINFFKEDVRFRLGQTGVLKRWVARFFLHHKIKIENINYIFCSDGYLRKLNKKYLQHDYFTDIITFDNSAEEGKTEGDIYISVDRVRANAKKFKTTFENELHRVIIHGALHLAGHTDKIEKQKKAMRNAEDLWLSLFKA